MSSIFTVSPDFAPEQISGWYIFNTWLQRQMSMNIHLELYNDFSSQRQAVAENKIDLIYVNPFDAAMLVREKNFLPLVKPADFLDEALIVVNEKSSIMHLADLKTQCKIAVTEDPNVNMIAMMLLEAEDLHKNNIQEVLCNNYVLIAKNLLRDNVDVGIFLATAYESLSSLIKKQLRVVLRSQINEIHHSLMISPQLADKREKILHELLTMSHCEKGKGVLTELGFTGWDIVDAEEMEFMIDLMDALLV